MTTKPKHALWPARMCYARLWGTEAGEEDRAYTKGQEALLQSVLHFISVCLCICLHTHVCHKGSEDNLWELSLSFYMMVLEPNIGYQAWHSRI